MRLSDIRCRECPYLDRYIFEVEGTCKKIDRYMAKVPWSHPRWCPRAAEEKAEWARRAEGKEES